VEVCTLSRRGDRFIPYPRHYSAAFAFSTILYPLWHRITLRFSLSAVPAGRRIGLTTFRINNGVGRVLPFRRRPCVSVLAPSRRVTGHMPFGQSPILQVAFGSLSLTTFNSSSLALTLQPSLAPHPDATSELTPSPRGVCVPQEGGYIVRTLGTPPLPVTHRS
jgi:hypothetical protein